MSSKPVDAAPYAAALREADPRLRSSQLTPLAMDEPSHLVTMREARFAAYRARADVRPPIDVPTPAKPHPDPEIRQAWNAYAAAYRTKLMEAAAPAPETWLAQAEASRAGAAAAREALRQHRQAS
ncbi:MAG TPA: hypothetical protein VHZ03_42910 [Trebonia sp.]|jgi:hypothetical protein|nr:hypothetical protein [Trebonia sp.]